MDIISQLQELVNTIATLAFNNFAHSKGMPHRFGCLQIIPNLLLLISLTLRKMVKGAKQVP
ncbi:hypothetical protein RHGRI_004494 [Rhododendron griersonianum]|uniref:Uncharacterized protein n=1 Tax=Rhododendron griersonianum TaxID=479676 RepID=A0AAV6IS68_9ERIC|nr:hypothetical protein RHGRI_026253 [Rhododendron griersonianum]KAG5561463.1 hypothetical protein RHGRI_004494 [Rhododendron griersonianum]